MTKQLIRFDQINNPQELAEDLQRLLLDRNNADISREFPNLAKRYSQGSIPEITSRILIDQTLQEEGLREWYLTYKDSDVVGFGAINLVQLPIAGTSGVDLPNLSGFIFKPYRGEGMGRFSLEERLKIIRTRFGGIAWTLVRLDNETSNQMVLSTPGFALHKKVAHNDKLYNLYKYSVEKEN